ncbi:MAG TPA: epimerase, partial [Candidatus Eisenbacteria bacterium]|nr:epimerase [Candidatus Eisenbacteria bacterium]
VPDGGRRPLRFVHADDVARALVALAERDAPPERFAYNLAQPDEPTLRELLALAAACLGASPRLVDVPAARLAAAGVDPDALPYAGRWCSRPDPALAASEWGFEAAPTAGYLPAVIRGHLEDAPPSHPGYAQRGRELELARALA